MTKPKYWLSTLAISVVLIAGSLAVGPIAIAGDEDDDDDDGGVTQTLLCPEGTFMIGIVTGGGDDDDDNGDGIIELICEDPFGVPPSQPGDLICTCDSDDQPEPICLDNCEASAEKACIDLCGRAEVVGASCNAVASCEGEG